MRVHPGEASSNSSLEELSDGFVKDEEDPSYDIEAQIDEFYNIHREQQAGKKQALRSSRPETASR